MSSYQIPGKPAQPAFIVFVPVFFKAGFFEHESNLVAVLTVAGLAVKGASQFNCCLGSGHARHDASDETGMRMPELAALIPLAANSPWVSGYGMSRPVTVCHNARTPADHAEKNAPDHGVSCFVDRGLRLGRLAATLNTADTLNSQLNTSLLMRLKAQSASTL